MKFLKTWSGVTSGTFLGRDDGHPTMIEQTFSSVEALVNAHGTKKNERYYKLVEISEDTISTLAEEIKEIKFEDMRKKKISELEKVIEESKREIGKLSNE